MTIPWSSRHPPRNCGSSCWRVLKSPSPSANPTTLIAPARQNGRRKSEESEALMKPLIAVILLGLTTGCSIKRMAVNQVGNALASGGSTFTSDDDPDLVAAAIPFGLKMYESLLAESPKHTGLLLAAAQGFTEYSYAFVDSRVDEAKEDSLSRANALRDRARKLYVRAYRYGMRGLEVRHPGFAEALDNDAAAALQRTGKRDVPLLYWTAASRGLAISLSKNSPEIIAELPLVEMIV